MKLLKDMCYKDAIEFVRTHKCLTKCPICGSDVVDMDELCKVGD